MEKTLYNEKFEHDACGIGAVVSIDGKKSHKIVDNALSIVEKLEHRAGKDATGETGDGVGILLQISHDFFRAAVATEILIQHARDIPAWSDQPGNQAQSEMPGDCTQSEMAAHSGLDDSAQTRGDPAQSEMAAHSGLDDSAQTRGDPAQSEMPGDPAQSEMPGDPAQTSDQPHDPVELGGERDYGIGMCFFPSDYTQCTQDMTKIEKLCQNEHLEFLGWRRVPINSSVLGKKALDCMPQIWQCFIKRPSDVAQGLDFDRKLYLVRRSFEHAKDVSGKTYIASFSSRTIVYKGMFLVNQLRTFYCDLQSTLYSSSLALVHSRFSTNTNPSWQRAHPNRFIAHNGEINTIRGNVDRMLAREETISSSIYTDEQMAQILPAVDTSGSDSAMLDNTLEFMVMNGIPLALAVMICIPEPWKHDEEMSEEKKDFYHYYGTMMESWDGPAAILFSDGDVVGATLDRNGLRPSRYYITRDNTLILSSEVGVLDISESDIVTKSRLMPGKILLVDTKQKRLISDKECKDYYAHLHPYGEWLNMNLVNLKDVAIPNKKIPVSTQEERDRLYKAFGWNYEDVNEIILPMAKNGNEPIASMGVDTPLAVMSENHPSLFHYFKQLFAQVTNPPIDSLREKIITDTTVYLGSDGNLLNSQSSNCRVLEVDNPILTGVDLLKIKSLNQSGLKTKVLSLLVECGTDDKIDLENAMQSLFSQIDQAYAQGYNIIVLSDRGVDQTHVAIPSLLAVSGVEQYLVRTKKRTAVSIVLESADVHDVHSSAMILSYGARALNPYLAHECIAELIDQKLLDKDYHAAIDDYNKALLNGIVKIAAKMGISTVQSYQSAQIFEAVGIDSDIINKYFTNTVSPVSGIGMHEIEEDVIFHHNQGFDKLGLTVNTHLDSVGFHKFRRGKNAEDHLYNPETIVALQSATQNGDYAKFKEYTSLVDDTEHPHTLRAMLDFDTDKAHPISIDEVESVDDIVRRFKTGAMSYGSISEEAHRCMAAAMNHLHGKSNSGEGGEKPERLGTEYNSAIKQVASARFGVTEEYLLSAQEIQIKMAQGAKPGEGGHLPKKKVYPWIAQTRFATPGVSLISPPPHHDIYSIEDLAQLIYDLKNANRKARISVKLVSEAGVGTIAAGVAKAGSQVILISGHDGGTGAAPISSIHHAGLPWELGLAETHQTLIQNGLRSRVTIETDGKLMSGRDVAIACLLGAEEFGFATAPLITMGCAMMRVCNLDTCPFGVATQNSELRKRFKGKPEYVENFMRFIAQELREYMALLGFHTINEMVGHNEMLKLKSKQGFKRAGLVDMSNIIQWRTPQGAKTHFDPNDVYNFKLEKTLDLTEFVPSFEKLSAPYDKENIPSTSLKICERPRKIESTSRTLGTILGSEIQTKFGSSLNEDSFVLEITGGAGQSLGAFIPKGLTIRLEGDANDYLGKGLSGGKIVVTTPHNANYKASENVIIGNVALFGATSGKAFINGIAGERFCVRNSGARVVVEGCGDHGLEYMTGGTAIILGPTGKNLCAGMSGGVAYVYDCDHSLYKKLNKELVTMSEVTDESDKNEIFTLISEHAKETGSVLAKSLLTDFDKVVCNFKKIIPNDYKKMLDQIALAESQGLDHEEAVMAAFNAVVAG